MFSLWKVCNKWRKRLQAIPGYGFLETDCRQVKKCIEIALACIENERKGRPKIGDIVNQLSKIERHTNQKCQTDEVRNNCIQNTWIEL